MRPGLLASRWEAGEAEYAVLAHVGAGEVGSVGNESPGPELSTTKQARGKRALRKSSAMRWFSVEREGQPLEFWRTRRWPNQRALSLPGPQWPLAGVARNDRRHGSLAQGVGKDDLRHTQVSDRFYAVSAVVAGEGTQRGDFAADVVLFHLRPEGH